MENNKEPALKNAKIWADIKFVPSDPNRKTILESTNSKIKKDSKVKRIGYHLKQILNIIIN